MGGDAGPSIVVPGALAGARSCSAELVLVGRERAIRSALGSAITDHVRFEIIEAEDEIGMHEQAAQAARRRPDSSVNVAVGLVKRREADAMVSAGNSGAVMASALLQLGRLPGVDRPAIASLIPTLEGETMLLDLGAVTDPKPENLVQFARMAVVYTQRLRGLSYPSVGLLSIGEEPGKGNQLVQDVFPRLQAVPGLNFIGNVEGKDLLRGATDIVVTDGFTGNVALKTIEGTASMLNELLGREVTRGVHRKLAAALLRPAFREAGRRLDYQRFGGAPLLGVDGVAVIAHGRSTGRAIANAVVAAATTVERGVVPAIAEAMHPVQR
jgi:glycerol-3-phosphate acyltransferase PlsX